MEFQKSIRKEAQQNMKTTAKRILSFFMILALCLSMGLTALADDSEVTEFEEIRGSEEAREIEPRFEVYADSGPYYMNDTIEVEILSNIETSGLLGYLSWSCSPEGYLRNNGNGTFTVIKQGARSELVEIYCTNYNAGTVVEIAAEATPDPAPVEALSVWLNDHTVDLSTSSDGYHLFANSSGGSGNVKYNWSVSSPNFVRVDPISGDGSIVSLTAVASGTTYVTVTGTDGAGRQDTDTCTVTVTSSGITVSGGGAMTMNISGTANRSAAASGGSGRYYYDWQASGGVSLTSYSSSGGSATVRADSTPSGKVTLTVYDQNDRSNYASATWNITVNSGVQVAGVEVKPNNVTLDAYSSCYLSLSVSPANASYSVTWSSSNAKVASVSGSGASATVSTYGNDGTAVITAAVRDNSTGKTVNATCTVRVSASSGVYNPSLTVTYGSDYYGTSVSDSIYNQFYKLFNVRLPSNATVRFTSTGTTNIGQLLLSNGKEISANTNYSFGDLQKMSFSPYRAGTFSIPYSVTYSGSTLSGTISVYVRSASLTVSLSPASMNMSTYSSQYLDLSVTPGNAYYRVSWNSNNLGIATVTGSGSRVTVTSQGKAGSATISATVTDADGVQVVKKCTVTVTNAGATYNASKVVTIGGNVIGSTFADSLANQYKSVYGTSLNSANATFRFSSLGDSKVAILKLKNGTPMTANTDYTFQQFIDCYSDPVSEGRLTTPYTLTYNGKSLSGNLITEVYPASVSAGITLPNSNGAYSFNTSLASGGTGASQITGGLNSVLASAASASWNYVRFSTASGQAGTLYANSSRAPLTAATNVTESGIANLCFVPSQPGTFTTAYTAYNANGGVVAKGTLSITIPGGTPPASGRLRVQLSSQKLTVNGVPKNTQIYNINDENYFRLRDIAYMLNGTGSQFAVDYDNATSTISITTGRAYSSLGTEMSTGADYSSTCVVSSMPLLINGARVNLTAYNIHNNTFYRLRDLGNSLGFNVDYNAATGTVVVTSR